jgi:nucleoside-diphosphate-sugar epimerase
MTKEILVIGGTGFLGKNVVKKALDLGWAVTNISNSGAGPIKATNISCDMGNPQRLEQVLLELRFDYVVNCGGYVSHQMFSNGGQSILENHFTSLLNLIEVINRDNLESFINIGSSDEYGGNPAPQTEDQRESSISPYSLGKVASTHFLQMLYRTEGFPGTTLRLFLPYGPGQGMNKLIPQIIDGCLRDSTFPASEGNQLRDFCFIDDVVDAIFLALQAKNAKGQVFNVGSGEPVSVKSVINSIISIIGKGNPQFGVIPYRSEENMNLYADTQKIRHYLGWTPKVSLEIGLIRTISSISKING